MIHFHSKEQAPILIFPQICTPLLKRPYLDATLLRQSRHETRLHLILGNALQKFEYPSQRVDPRQISGRESLSRNILGISQSEVSPLKSMVQDREVVLSGSQCEMVGETVSHLSIAGCSLFVIIDDMRS
jgi:hypothetical protein